MKRLIKLTLTSAVPMLFIPTLHYIINPSYLDPGTGSIIIQALLGGLVGVAVILKIFWARVITFFKNLRSRARKSKDD